MKLKRAIPPCDGNLALQEKKQSSGSRDFEATRIEGNIPIDLPITNGHRYLFISHDQRAFTHGIHKYPAKFFPELPRWIIQRYSSASDKVLDPFMGSGTTNLEAMLLGRFSVGIDVDPFARLLANVKTTLIDPEQLLVACNKLFDYLDSYKQSGKLRDVPEFPYRENWFQPFVLEELAFIKRGIEALSCIESIKQFFLICFSSVIRQVSQADNNCTRTVIRKKLNKTVRPTYSFELFRKRTEFCVNGMLELVQRNPLASTEIPHDSSATDMARYADQEFDLAVTSPPYMNAVDYPRTHQLEMYWLGLANGSLRNLKRKHVGTEIVMAKEYEDLLYTGIDSADSIIQSIYAVDRRRAFIAYRFIQDMVSNLKEVHRVLKQGGRYVVVIGSNQVRGMNFESWRYLRDASISVGFEVENYFISGIINHFIKVPRKERIEDDYIIILKRT